MGNSTLLLIGIFTIFLAIGVITPGINSAYAATLTTYNNDKTNFLSDTFAVDISGVYGTDYWTGSPIILNDVTIDKSSGSIAVGTGSFPLSYPNGDWTALMSGKDIAIQGQEDLDITINTGTVSCFGFDFVEPTSINLGPGDAFIDSRFDITLKDGVGTVGTYLFEPDNDVATFTGVCSDVPFDKVEVREIIEATTTHRENEFYGHFYASVGLPPLAACIDLDILDFETFENIAEPITDQYETFGAHFRSDTIVPLKILDDTGETPKATGPHILVSNIGANNGNIIIDIVEPTTGDPTDASKIEFSLFSIGNNAIEVKSWDSADGLIPGSTQVFQHLNEGGANCNYPEWLNGCPGPITNGWAQTDNYTFDDPNNGIRKVTVTGITNPLVDGDGYGIDDLQITLCDDALPPQSCIDVTFDFESYDAGVGVEGLNAIHPDLDIQSPDDYDTKVIEVNAPGLPMSTAYNTNTNVNNGCLDGEKGIGPWNYFGYPNDAAATDRVSLDFTFNGKTTDSFSIDTFDYGDFNPKGGDMVLEMNGYDASNTLIAHDEFTPTKSSIYDACASDGKQTLQVSEPGISRIEIRATSGPDPGVGYDNLKFTICEDTAFPPEAIGTLQVTKITIPDNDSGLFNLLIDNVVEATDVGNNGMAGPNIVSIGPHNVSETAGTGTDLADYVSVINGDCDANGDVTLVADQIAECTITNTKEPTLKVTKILDPTDDTGLFNLLIDNAVVATDVTHNEMSDPEQVTVGEHTVSEAAGTGTDLADYVSVIGGDCNSDGTITLVAGEEAECIITNTKVFDAVKTWTHTDYNWDEICTEYAIVEGVETDECIAYRLANINTDDVLADPLEGDDAEFTLDGFANKKGFQNTNPGAFFALTTVDVNVTVDSLTVVERYDDCTVTLVDGLYVPMLELLGSKQNIETALKAAIAAPNGDVTEISSKSIVTIMDDSSATVVIQGPIDAESTVYVLVKFSDALSGQDVTLPVSCTNEEIVGVTIDTNPFETTVDAILTIIEK